MPQRVKVLIVDDSAIVRETLQSVLSFDPAIEVIATAADPFIAAMKMLERKPDVIVLDINMPRMDGLTFLKKIMAQHPIPVVICSSLTQQGADETMRALEYGAVDIITKPKVGTKRFLEESRIRICDAVKAASFARVRRPAHSLLDVGPKYTADVMLPPPSGSPTKAHTDRVVVMGASTGGTEAIVTVLCQLPADGPGVLIVQHLPEQFTNAFARRLDGLCALSVSEAKNGDPVQAGTALVAPGDKHLMVKREGSSYRVEVAGGELVSRHRPSVDVLFRSAAVCAGGNAIGVLLTGMGADGAQGMLEMHEAGAFTIAQDEASSVVWGMPAEAVELGAVDEVVPLGEIAAVVARRARV